MSLASIVQLVSDGVCLGVFLMFTRMRLVVLGALPSVNLDLLNEPLAAIKITCCQGATHFDRRLNEGSPD